MRAAPRRLREKRAALAFTRQREKEMRWVAEERAWWRKVLIAVLAESPNERADAGLAAGARAQVDVPLAVLHQDPDVPGADKESRAGQRKSGVVAQ